MRQNLDIQMTDPAIRAFEETPLENSLMGIMHNAIDSSQINGHPAMSGLNDLAALSKARDGKIDDFSLSGYDLPDLSVSLSDSQEASSIVELAANDFQRLGPRAAEIMRQVGVEKLKVEHLADHDLITLKLSAPFEQPQDPLKDHCKKLVAGVDFRAEISKGADGSIVFDNIEGLKAIKTLFGADRELTVEKISLKKTADGRTQVTSEAYLGLISSKKVKTVPAEIFEKASIMFERIHGLR